MIYVVSYTSYFAVNAATGTLLWQQNLFRYLDQNATMAPAVSGNVLSFASCNVAKQSRGLPGCYVYAFSTSNGEAFDAPTHQPRWGQSQNSTGASFRAPGQPVLLFASNHSISRARISGGIGSGVPFILSHGLIYVEETPSAIDVLSTSNGSIGIQLNIAATDGFLIA